MVQEANVFLASFYSRVAADYLDDTCRCFQGEVQAKRITDSVWMCLFYKTGMKLLKYDINLKEN